MMLTVGVIVLMLIVLVSRSFVIVFRSTGSFNGKGALGRDVLVSIGVVLVMLTVGVVVHAFRKAYSEASALFFFERNQTQKSADEEQTEEATIDTADGVVDEENHATSQLKRSTDVLPVEWTTMTSVTGIHLNSNSSTGPSPCVEKEVDEAGVTIDAPPDQDNDSKPWSFLNSSRRVLDRDSFERSAEEERLLAQLAEKDKTLADLASELAEKNAELERLVNNDESPGCEERE